MALPARIVIFVIVMDADLQHPPEVLPDIVKALESHDFVMGFPLHQRRQSRRVETIPENCFEGRNPYGFAHCSQSKRPHERFFGFKRAVLDTATLSPTGWKIGLEILVRSKFKSVTEVPYTFVARATVNQKLSRRIIWQYVQQLMDLYSFK